MKKKQTRKYKQQKDRNQEDLLARQMAKQEEMQQEMRQRREEAEYYNHPGVDMVNDMDDGYHHN